MVHPGRNDMRSKSLGVAAAGMLLAMSLSAAPAALGVENQAPVGFHDVWDGVVGEPQCAAAGWAVDDDSPYTRLNVRVLADGVEVADGVADQFRQDLLDAGVSPDGYASFDIWLWGLVEPDVAHLITVQAQDAQTAEWVDLGATPKTLTCTDVNDLPTGTHDALGGQAGPNSCVAAGWAVDPDDRYADLNIQVLSDGAPVAIAVAGDFRIDLLEAGVSPDGYSAFNVNLWGLVAPNVAHEVTVQAQDLETGAWVSLEQTPKTLTCNSITGSTPNPKTSYFVASCSELGVVTVEAVFFASGNQVGGSTSAFRVMGDNRVFVIYTGGTVQNADDFCTFAWVGGWEPIDPWNVFFGADVFVAPKAR